jgi:hypothetical protein
VTPTCGPPSGIVFAGGREYGRLGSPANPQPRFLDEEMETATSAANNHFANHAEFEAFMREIDAEMRAEQVPIPARELRGFSRAAQKLAVTLRGGPLAHREPVEGIYSGDDLSLHIRKWFRTKYGDRLKEDFSPGTIPILIDGDAYAMALPRVYGTVRLTCDPSTHGTRVGSAVGFRDPPIFNILDSIRELTRANSMSFSQQDLAMLCHHFTYARDSFDWIERVPEGELVKSAVADLASSTQAILGKPIHFGLSRWASLQATEKFYKHYIATKGATYRFIHDIDELDDKTRSLGFYGLPERVRELIRCKPEVRYDGSTSSLVQAVEACQASVFACGSIAREIVSEVKLI